MRRLSKLNILVGFVVLVTFIFLIYIFTFREYEVKRFEENNEVLTLKNPVSENIRVVDAKSGELLFWYNEDGSIQATKIEKVNNGKWVIVIEDISKR